MDGMESGRVLEHMRTRASCRGFESRAIPEGLLEDILKTGITAASGGNLQPFSIIAVKDSERNARLAELCGGQGFIAQAPVNLLFVLDWHKFSLFAAHERAPFTCPVSFMPYVIALEDVICAAQTIETAAHICGLGSCYVGTVNGCGSELIGMFNLPKFTYPVVMLSLGYPKEELKTAPKLPYEAMVFNERYPDKDWSGIIDAFRAKYGDRAMPLPSGEEQRAEMLKKFRDALLTTFGADEADGIIAQAETEGRLNETQRRFGLHYHAAAMRESGKSIIKMMTDNGLMFFEH
jgi:FMN reductase [NAD(P)H]